MNKEAFAVLVLSSTDSLYRISKSILRNDADCEDAVQEAIAVGFDKLHTLKHEKYAKTWLTRILINECYNILRKQKKFGTMYEEAQSIEYVNNDYSDLYLALNMLKKEYRLTIVLYYLEGYSMKEIAGIMRIKVGTVKSRLSRGRNELRRILESEMVHI
ncbi:MAG: sigma-70 family RNA polymerase sigma factor [Clostridiales bacterium]|nr:sigma-70 family RNA polymerase sigma factor [Clostridiales bacterium]